MTKTVQVLPHAGGSASALRGWFSNLADAAKVSVVEYPGHGKRYAEAPATSIDRLVEAALAQTDASNSSMTSIFGHSMGSFVALETVRALTNSCRAPQQLFVSACGAPGGKAESWSLDLSDGELLTELSALGGTPQEIMEDEELASMIVRTMRSDLELTRSYLSSPVERIPQNIIAFYGVDDTEVALSDVQRWADFSSGKCELVPLEGGHFYSPRSREQLVAKIVRTIDDAS